MKETINVEKAASRPEVTEEEKAVLAKIKFPLSIKGKDIFDSNGKKFITLENVDALFPTELGQRLMLITKAFNAIYSVASHREIK